LNLSSGGLGTDGLNRKPTLRFRQLEGRRMAFGVKKSGARSMTSNPRLEKRSMMPTALARLSDETFLRRIVAGTAEASVRTEARKRLEDMAAASRPAASPAPSEQAQETAEGFPEDENISPTDH